jgi:hypothetical protein
LGEGLQISQFGFGAGGLVNWLDFRRQRFPIHRDLLGFVWAETPLRQIQAITNERSIKRFTPAV